ncbi:MAG: hypothetical protein IPH33_19545 [Bacteroidetes bacterium]|nr:hypothetical protein [Bacteroidota bacterium]
MRFSIHDSTAGGMVVYQETQNKTTSVLGLFTANIGEGVVVNGTFLQLIGEVILNSCKWNLMQMGGTNYIDLGTQQMLRFPLLYFLHKV